MKLLSTAKLTASLVVTMIGFMAEVSWAAQQCEQAKTFYQQGMELGKQGKWKEALTAADKSTSLCNRFDNWYLLGQIQQKRKNYEEAGLAFVEARKFAKNDNQVSIALARYAESLGALGHTVQAASLAHHARSFSAESPAWIVDLAKKLDLESAKKPMSKNDITRALDERAYRNLKINAKPKINMRVNFKYDSVDLISDEQFNAQILAEALGEPQFDDKTLTIIGHTDTTGEFSYNDSLSIRRAQAIYNKLVTINPSLKSKIVVEGKGESQPLWSEKDDTEKMLNRRIEVRLD